jgi:hypothetical protein
MGVSRFPMIFSRDHRLLFALFRVKPFFIRLPA